MSGADAAEEAAWESSPAGRVDAAPDALAALAAAADTQREELADLLAATAGGGPADRPRIAVTGAVSGALLTLTDLPGLRRAGHCGAPVCRRRPEDCTHDLTGRPACAHPTPPARTGRRGPGSLRPRPRPALPVSRLLPPHAQGRLKLDHVIAHPTGTPPPRTWPASAPPTTVASTRPRAGPTRWNPTAP
jgi:hypothetical protein